MRHTGVHPRPMYVRGSVMSNVDVIVLEPRSAGH